ncbi:hypothetical protein [Variovorax sp. Varisp36]|jgi:hypothetical protein|uniref:hypothetical protein n=1 Tax=Variovorax sp. Varisp36 TaxID=3243031 RepID=UPI0039A73640
MKKTLIAVLVVFTLGLSVAVAQTTCPNPVTSGGGGNSGGGNNGGGNQSGGNN